MSIRSVPVWDVPTRLFHWALVAAVVTSYLTGGDEGVWFAVHTASGYVIALLLLFRIAWGFLGSPRSRFADFVRGRSVVLDYAKRLAHGTPPRFIGHNPLGGWMVVAMLVVLTLAVLTGLFSSHGEGEAYGLLYPFIADFGREGLGEVHELVANLVVLLAGLHIAGVAVDWLLTGEPLVRSMITGRKALPAGVAAAEPRLAPAWRALLVALLVAVAGVALFRRTDFTAIAAHTHEHGEHAAEEDEHD